MLIGMHSTQSIQNYFVFFNRKKNGDFNGMCSRALITVYNFSVRLHSRTFGVTLE